MAARVARLIRQLGHDEFAKREAASKELDAIGEPALDALRKAAASSDDAEIRRRAERIVDAVTGRIRAAAAKADIEKLRGTWYIVSFSNQGVTTGEDKTCTITYDGTKYTQRRGDQLLAEGVIEIVDVTARPKRIDYTVTGGLYKGLYVQSIYTVDGDDHQICSVAGTRPTEFSGKAGSYYVTKRVRK